MRGQGSGLLGVLFVNVYVCSNVRVWLDLKDAMKLTASPETGAIRSASSRTPSVELHPKHRQIVPPLLPPRCDQEFHLARVPSKSVGEGETGMDGRDGKGNGVVENCYRGEANTE